MDLCIWAIIWLICLYLINFMLLADMNLEGRDASSCQISSKPVSRLRRYCDFSIFFLKMAAVRHLGFVWRVFGPSTKIIFTAFVHFMQNLVAIVVIVSIIWKFQYLARLATKRLFTDPKLGSWGFLPSKYGTIATTCQTCTFLHEFASFEPSSVKIRRALWPVGEYQKGIN